MSHSLGMFVILLLILVQLGLLGFNVVTYYLRSQASYFAVTPGGQRITLTASSRPNVSTKALLSWATMAATATLTLDFVNIDKNLETLKPFFTTEGYENFIAALEADSVIDTITSKKLVLSAVPVGPAIILSEDEIRGFHLWTVQVPILVSYLSSSAEEKSSKLVTLVISQVPTQAATTGIGIIRYQAAGVSSDILRDLL